MIRNRDILGIECEALNAKPELFPDLLDIYYSFHILNRTRGVTDFGAPKPIQLSDIKLLYDVFDIAPLLSFKAYLQCIMRMQNTIDSIVHASKPK